MTVLCIVCWTTSACADEGMWLPDHPPVKILKEKYNFEPSPQWLEHAQKSTVSFGYATGSFVSRDGLILTNHHVVADTVGKMSTAERNYSRDGFYARDRSEELKCPGMELRVLWSIQDVTPNVVADTEKLPPAEQFEGRRKKILTIEKESEEQTGLNSEVVTLFGGMQYHLYRYKRYTDVRLVFCPDESTAFFGGDADNFEYPRFDHDFAMVRVYDDAGQPLHPEHYLRINPAGSKEGDLLFDWGCPGETKRLHTVDHLVYDRDVEVPADLQSLWRDEIKLQSFSKRSREYQRIATELLLNIENGRKDRTGALAALQDPKLMEHKIEAEKKLRASVDGNPTAKAQYGDAWQQVSDSLKTARQLQLRRNVLGEIARPELCSMGRTIVQLVAEKAKPNDQRLPEYGDARLDSIMLELYSPAPIEEALEIQRLASALGFAAEQLGADDPLVKLILDGKSPSQRAIELVRGTHLKDVDFRKKLVEGGASAVSASDDPMIRLALAIDPQARAVRKQWETDVEAVQRDAYTKIAAARFAVSGSGAEIYPDATDTLRMEFGVVKGYREDDGREIAPYTTYAGLYDHWRDREGPKRFEPPFYLTPKWVAAEKKVDLKTPLDFVLTADIIGGNSGSPVTNRDGELVGLIFDGNIQGLIADYAYDETQARGVALDVRAILTALRDVYDAAKLAGELVEK
jgi:hypothetical protein